MGLLDRFKQVVSDAWHVIGFLNPGGGSKPGGDQDGDPRRRQSLERAVPDAKWPANDQQPVQALAADAGGSVRT